MIAFAVIPNEASGIGQLVYRRNEVSFDTQSSPGGCPACIIINDVQLHFDDRNRVGYVSGYCPWQGWGKTHLSPPPYSNAALVVVTPKSVQSGTGVGLNDLDTRWPVQANPEGWVCIGDPAERGDKAIEFAPSSVAVLRGNALVALWLHPTMVGGA